ncbi:MAG: hypothetical protein ABI370_03545 [Gammaproteobacteria bacterium]
MINKRKINTRHTLNLGEAVCLVAAVYFICYVLRQDDILPISINSAWCCISHFTKHFHVLAVGLLPVYVALMVFGTAIFGIYLGSALQRLVTQFLPLK